MSDELSAPLMSRSARKAARTPGRPRLPLARFALLLIILVFGGVALRLYLVDDPEGGRPSAEVAINTTRDANPVAGLVANPPGSATIMAEPETTIPVEGGPSITVLGENPPL